MAVEWLVEGAEKVETVVADRRIIGTDDAGVEDVLLCVPGDEVDKAKYERWTKADAGRVRTAKTRSPRSK